MTKKLFQNLPLIFKKIKQAENIDLFLDYDGTLVGFQNKPDMVKTPEKVSNCIKEIIKNKKFNVFIITGRTLEDIKKLVKIQGLNYAAVHGIQIQNNNGEEFVWNDAEKIQPVIKKIKKQSLKCFNEYKDVTLEDKKFTLALHYRNQIEEKNNETVKKFKKIVKDFDENNNLDLIFGSKVIEVRPKGWDKGNAVEYFLEKKPEKNNSFVLYLGDDTTDEDAFSFLNKKNLGLSVYVENYENRETKADFYVKNPDKVYDFLKNLPGL